MAYIIDTYDKYDAWDRQHARKVFEINGQTYAVKEVILFWGQPQLPQKLDRETNPETYRLYPTLDDALNFVKYMKMMNK